MRGYTVVIRRKHKAMPEIVNVVNNKHGAETLAQDLYNQHQLDLAMVVIKGGEYDSGKVRIVFKIERRCKHYNVQLEMFRVETPSTMEWRCMECGLDVKPVGLFSKFEESSLPACYAESGEIHCEAGV